MPAIARSVASLRIIGDDLIPGDITRILCCAPTRGQQKGDVFRDEKTKHERIARFGMWTLEAMERTPSDPGAQISELLAKLSDDLKVWQSITDQFRADVFFGLFMKGLNEGVELSPAILLALGSRGIKVGFDIYGQFPKTPNQFPLPTPGAAD